MERRAEHLVEQGLAERQGQRVTFTRNLIDTLRRGLEALGEKLAAETGQPFTRAASGEYVAGTYRQRFTLASGRFAMIDDGLGFQLVPWTPSLESSSAATSPASPAATAASTGASAASAASASNPSQKGPRHVRDENPLGPDLSSP
jgi:hypothetical protein